MNKFEINYLDLFSGIGGFALGLRMAGFKFNKHYFSEVEEYGTKLYSRRFPGAIGIGDINGIIGRKLGTIDVLTAGVPCQPASVAGQRKGESDDRWLWPQTIAAIEYFKPGWIILENVLGLTGLAKQYGLPKVENKTLQRLKQSDYYEKIFTRQEILLLGIIIDGIEKAGYELPKLIDGTPAVLCVPACAVNAPHRRDRVWIVANAIGERNRRRSKNSRQVLECEIPETEIKRSDSKVVANTKGRRLEKWGFKREQQKTTEGFGTEYSNTEINSYSEGNRYKRQEKQAERISRPSCDTEEGRERERIRIKYDSKFKGTWLEAATELCRMDDGLPARLDGFKLSKAGHRVARLKGLGNAVVPQIIEIIGKSILYIYQQKEDHYV